MHEKIKEGKDTHKKLIPLHKNIHENTKLYGDQCKYRLKLISSTITTNDVTNNKGKKHTIMITWNERCPSKQGLRAVSLIYPRNTCTCHPLI